MTDDAEWEEPGWWGLVPWHMLSPKAAAEMWFAGKEPDLRERQELIKLAHELMDRVDAEHAERMAPRPDPEPAKPKGGRPPANADERRQWYVSAIQRLRSKEIPVTDESIARAIQEWVREAQGPVADFTCSAATVARWRREHGLPASSEVRI